MPSGASVCHFAFFPILCLQQLEWRTLSMVRGLSDQLRSACSGVVSSAQGLPGVVQDQLTSARRSAEELHSSLGNTSILTPLLLEQSRRHLTQVLHQAFLVTASNQINPVQKI